MLKSIEADLKDKICNHKLYISYRKRYEETRSAYFKTRENYTYTKKLHELTVMTENLETGGLMRSDGKLGVLQGNKMMSFDIEKNTCEKGRTGDFFSSKMFGKDVKTRVMVGMLSVALVAAMILLLYRRY
jgi:hypothetical protein